MPVLWPSEQIYFVIRSVIAKLFHVKTQLTLECNVDFQQRHENVQSRSHLYLLVGDPEAFSKQLTSIDYTSTDQLECALNSFERMAAGKTFRLSGIP